MSCTMAQKMYISLYVLCLGEVWELFVAVDSRVSGSVRKKDIIVRLVSDGAKRME